VGYVEELRALVGHRPLILVVSGMLIVDEHERVLLMERADTHDWGIVGGIMEPGETLEQTARREVQEEIGLEVGNLTFLAMFSGPEFFSRYPNGDEVHPVLALYTARYDGQELRLDPHEALQTGFFAQDALPQPLRPSIPHYLAAYRQAAGRA